MLWALLLWDSLFGLHSSLQTQKQIGQIVISHQFDVLNVAAHEESLQPLGKDIYLVI
jgi:hypothetical protein